MTPPPESSGTRKLTSYHYLDLPRKERPDLWEGTRDQEILDAVNRSVAGATTLEEMIDFVFITVRRLLHCDRIGIAFVDEDGLRITSRYVVADYQPILLGGGYSEFLAESSLTEVLERGAIRIINDLQRYSEEKPDSRSTQLILQEGVRSSMTCPLTVNGRNVGVIFLSSREQWVFGAHNAQLFLAIAERLSQAVEKARQIELLKQSNFGYRHLLRFLGEETYNRVASMVTNTRLLDEGFLGELSQEQRARIDAILLRGESLLSLLREYSELEQIEGGRLAVELRPEVDAMEDVIAPVAEMLAPLAKERRMTLAREVEKTPRPVTCDPSLMRSALRAILRNAIKFGREGGAIRLVLKCEPKRFLITVWNEGDGFPPEKKSSLFRKFSGISPANGDHHEAIGTGIGLYVAWRIAHEHGGKIEANSKQGEWAEFRLEIPQPPHHVGA